jgi:hypothetical protein
VSWDIAARLLFDTYCGKCGNPCQVVERPHLTPPMQRLSDCCSSWIRGDKKPQVSK